MEITRNRRFASSIYSDIDALFKIHPIKKDLTILTDRDAVNKSIRNLLLTNHYERLFHPEIGSNISKMLFENIGSTLVSVIEREIFDTITNFEPRVKVTSVIVFEDERRENTLSVEIAYYYVTDNETTIMQLPLATPR